MIQCWVWIENALNQLSSDADSAAANRRAGGLANMFCA